MKLESGIIEPDLRWKWNGIFVYEKGPCIDNLALPEEDR